MKKIIKKLTIFVSALVLALLFSALLVFSASADAPKPEVTVNAVSLGLEDRICLLYRASITGLDDYLAEHPEYYNEYELSMQFKTSPSGSWSDATSPYRVDGGYYYFSYNGQKPMEMVDSVYSRLDLYLDGGSDEEHIYSDVVRYSVLDYAYATRGNVNTRVDGGATLGELVQKILEYGALSQRYFGYKTEHLATDAFYFVRAENAHFADGTKTAIVFPGQSVTLTKEGSGGVFDHWEDQDGNVVSSSETAVVTPTADTTYHPVEWEEIGVSEGLAFETLTATTCALSGIGTCTDVDLVVPNRDPEGRWVTKINPSALAGNEEIASVRIPASVTVFGSGAFDGCSSLVSVTVEAGNPAFSTEEFLFLWIESGSFSGGYSSKVLLSGEGVTLNVGTPPIGCSFDHWEDGDGNFVSSNATPTVHPTADTFYRAIFGDPEMEAGASLGLVYKDLSGETCAVSGIGTCTDTALVIPSVSPTGKFVTRINASALSGNTNLTSVRIPASLTTIENGAFEGCTSISEFIVQEGNTSFTTYYGALLNGDGSVFLRYPPARTSSLSLPSSVRTVADRAFTDAGLGTLTLNNDLETIGSYAFARSAITSINIKAAVTSIGSYAFDHCSQLTSVSVNSSNTHYKATTYAIYTIDGLTLIRGKNYSGSITSFLSGVTTFAPGCYSGCDKVTLIKIPNSVTVIGESAFADCTALRSPTIGSAVQRIEARAFYGCNKSTFSSVTLPASVTYLGDSAFENCSYLATFVIQGTLSFRGQNVLRGTLIDENHEHSFTKLVTLSTASCEHGTVQTYACACGQQTGERFVTSGIAAHSYSGSTCSVCGQMKAGTSYDAYLQLPTSGAMGEYYGSFDPSDSGYSSIDNCNILYYDNVSAGSYESYLNKLRDAGLTQEKAYTLGANRYALFRHSTYTLYVSYLDTEQAMRIYVGMPNDLVPSNEPIAKASVATPSLWQININNKAAGSNGGMSYVIQLSDGKFIVVDGGYETSEDAASIYNILTTYKPASHAKPIIAGWFLTHMHIDHVGAYRAFANNDTYRNGVVLEGLYYSFLYTNVGDLWPSNSNNWESNMASRWPSATRYRKLHSGMNFTFAGAEVRILCAPEDVYPRSFNSGNDTSTVFQVILEGQKILFLGDAETG